MEGNKKIVFVLLLVLVTVSLSGCLGSENYDNTEFYEHFNKVGGQLQDAMQLSKEYENEKNLRKQYEIIVELKDTYKEAQKNTLLAINSTEDPSRLKPAEELADYLKFAVMKFEFWKHIQASRVLVSESTPIYNEAILEENNTRATELLISSNERLIKARNEVLLAKEIANSTSEKRYAEYLGESLKYNIMYGEKLIEAGPYVAIDDEENARKIIGEGEEYLVEAKNWLDRAKRIESLIYLDTDIKHLQTQLNN